MLGSLLSSFFAMNLIADSADPLAPFMHALLFKAVPVIVLCAVIGPILGSLKGGAEKIIERGVRRLVHGSNHQNPVASFPASSPPVVADAPHCPACNALMVLRQSKRGARAGQQFWGCPAYPKCRGVRASNSVGEPA